MTWATMAQTAVTSRVKLLICVLVMIPFACSYKNESLDRVVRISVSLAVTLFGACRNEENHYETIKDS